MRRSLLIVEDSTAIGDALRLLFEANGYAVTTAGTVADAIDAATRAVPDTMLLDLALPDGDGLEVIAALDAAGRLPSDVIALTGHDDEIVRDRCLAAGCRAVLVKPVPTRELLATVGSP